MYSHLRYLVNVITWSSYGLKPVLHIRFQLSLIAGNLGPATRIASHEIGMKEIWLGRFCRKMTFRNL